MVQHKLLTRIPCVRFGGLLGLFMAFFCLAACSDDEVKVTAEVVLPSESVLSAGLEAYSYTLEMQITSDTEWRVEFDEAGDEIAYALPASGKGNATVKLCILDNLESVRRTGQMTVVFPADPTKNRSCTLAQKATGTDENYDEGLVGERRYGIGYGFDLTKGVSPRGLRYPILKKEVLRQEQGAVQVAADSRFEILARTYTGRTVKELSNQFASEAKLKGSGWGIESDANLVFNPGYYSKGQYEYALSYLHALQERIVINKTADELKERNEVTRADGTVTYEYTYLTNAAGEALNAPDNDPKYSSTDEGFSRLIKMYGTHLVQTGSLGGRLLYSLCVDASKVSGRYDLGAYARLSYDGVVEAADSLRAQYGSSFAANLRSVETKMLAWGGDHQLVVSMNGTTGEALHDLVNEWVQGLTANEDQWTFIGYDTTDDLVPIYDLIYDKRRASLLQEFIESGRYAESQKHPSYELGVQGVLEGLAGLKQQLEVTEGSLILDVGVGERANHLLACVCSEFIPALDERHRVLVVYPVLDGKTKFNMGYFTGNSTHAPCHVVNIGSGRKGQLQLYPIYGEPVGQRDRLYMRGSSISDEPIDPDTEVVPVSSEERRGWFPGKTEGYPLLKLGALLWMRENYEAVTDTKGNSLHQRVGSGMYAYDFSYAVAKSKVDGQEHVFYFTPNGSGRELPEYFAPDGWRMPLVNELQAVIDETKHYNILPSEGWKPGGRWGLDVHCYGYVDAKGRLREDGNMGCLMLYQPNEEVDGTFVSDSWSYVYAFSAESKDVSCTYLGHDPNVRWVQDLE